MLLGRCAASLLLSSRAEATFALPRRLGDSVAWRRTTVLLTSRSLSPFEARPLFRRVTRTPSNVTRRDILLRSPTLLILPRPLVTARHSSGSSSRSPSDHRVRLLVCTIRAVNYWSLSLTSIGAGGITSRGSLLVIAVRFPVSSLFTSHLPLVTPSLTLSWTLLRAPFAMPLNACHRIRLTDGGPSRR